MTDSKQRQSEDLEVQSAEGKRRPYARPTLTTYGNVREFTRGGGGSNADKEGPQQ